MDSCTTVRAHSFQEWVVSTIKFKPDGDRDHSCYPPHSLWLVNSASVFCAFVCCSNVWLLLFFLRVSCVKLLFWLCFHTLCSEHILQAFFRCLICAVFFSLHLLVLEMWSLLRLLVIHLSKASILHCMMLLGEWKSVYFGNHWCGGNIHTMFFSRFFFLFTHRVWLKWKPFWGGNGHRQQPSQGAKR